MRTKCALSFAATLILLSAGTAFAVTCGDAYYNHDINWPGTSALYYTVAGAPPNSCGDLWVSRNGSAYTLNAAGWICTDANGTATKGPWTSNPADETAFGYINWGSCTSPIRKHIWDVSAPSVSITSPVPSTSFSGSASDGSWGAGFSTAWTSSCLVQYYDSTDGLYWTPGGSGFSQPFPYNIGTTITGMPSLNITWSANQVPGSLFVGHCYTYKAQCWDGGQWGYASRSFCI